jgi:hypothetical protein
MDVAQLKELDLSGISNKGYTKVGYRRNEFLKTLKQGNEITQNIILGRERKLILPNGEQRRSIFAIVSLNDILASHNEKSFAPTENYPIDENGKTINDRDYQREQTYQLKVKKVAQKLMPDMMISTSATESGTPIISIDGIVVSGNNRTMSLKLTDDYWSYRETLQKELRFGGYGYDKNLHAFLQHGEVVLPSSFHGPRRRAKISKPVLVRIDLDFPEYTSAELSKYNVDTKKSSSAIEQAINISNKLRSNLNCKNEIINVLRGSLKTENISEFFTKYKEVKKLLNVFIKCEIISENELAKFLTERGITASGKVLLTNVLLGAILEPDVLRISDNVGVKLITIAVTTSILPLLENSRFNEASIIADVNNAFLLENFLRSNNVDKESIDNGDFLRQQKMFDEEQGNFYSVQ